MAFKHRYADGWYKNAAGLYVQAEPISAALVAAASTDQVVAKKSDGSLYLKTVSGGGGGGATVLYDSGALASAANSIDSGAAGIAGGYDVLEIWAMLRTDETGTRSDTCQIRFNADSGANYTRERITIINATVGGSVSTTATGVELSIAAASTTANVFGVVRATVPFYTETTAYKLLELTQHSLDGGSSTLLDVRGVCWKNTAAITRVSVHAPSTKSFIAGSHVIVYGR